MKITILGLAVLFVVVRCEESTTGVSVSTATPVATEATTGATESRKPTTTSTSTTTTAAPTTPTTAPTTTAASNTTTETPEPPATPTPPIFPSDSALFPAPVSFSVKVKDSVNDTCLKGSLAAQFVLVNGTKYLNLENATVEESTCDSENATTIDLKFTFGGNNASLIFKRDEKLTSAWLDSIHLSYHSDNVSATVDHWDYNTAEKLLVSNGTAGYGLTYNCKGGEIESKKDLGMPTGNKVVFKSVDVQVGSPSKGNSVTYCPADEDVNDMIPIAVGAALLALVAIVLVAYFVGRRRSRRLAYQSV